MVLCQYSNCLKKRFLLKQKNDSEAKQYAETKYYSGIKENSERKMDMPKLFSRSYFSASVAERVIAENKAEKEAKEAIQKGIDMEWKMKSGGCSEC